jgi:hypothetical protein
MQVEDYLRLVQRNGECVALLAAAARKEKPARDVSDWIITLHFYILCVYLKALGQRRGRMFQDHVSIRGYLNLEPDLLKLARPYRQVEEWSRDARYEGRLFTPDEVRRFHSHFITVRDGIVELIVKSGMATEAVPIAQPVFP